MLVTTVDERIHQSSLEEHTLPLAQQHPVSLVTYQQPVHELTFLGLRGTLKYNIPFSHYQISQQKWGANVFSGHRQCL